MYFETVKDNTEFYYKLETWWFCILVVGHDQIKCIYKELYIYILEFKNWKCFKKVMDIYNIKYEIIYQIKIEAF